MDSHRFLIGERIFPTDDPQLQEALSWAYSHGARPRCLCIPDGIEMYVARHHQYVVKRMPGTGGRHHPACPSFEPDAQQSGLGELMGEAIIETVPGTFELRVDFPWTRLTRPGNVRGTSGESGEVAVARRRMSLRALTHLLFERAGLNLWSPAFTGKRHQGILEKKLYAAASEMIVKGNPLSERLYVPEPFSVSALESIASRRRKKLAILQPQDCQFPLAVVIGEFKSCEAAVTGRRVFIKHMPDAPFLVSPRVWERIEKLYAGYFDARDVDTGFNTRLVLTALIHARHEHAYEIDTASMMLTSEHWIPLESFYELPLIQALIAQQRRFAKPLRYDANSSAAFANALLLDVGTQPLGLHVVSPYMSDSERKSKEAAIAACGNGAWVWYTDEAMPPFMQAKP
jgi:hypothetical protein